MTEAQATELLQKMDSVLELLDKLQNYLTVNSELLAFFAGLTVGFLAIFVFLFFIKGAA